MSKLTDLGNCDSLLKLKERFEAYEAKVREERLQERETEHKKHHIFTSYGKALDYLVDNPGSGIQWHTASVYWDEEKKKFEVYDQSFDIDGVIPYDVHYFCTREELLQGHTEHDEWLKSEQGKDYNPNWYLDKYGKLEYVYAYSPVKRGFKLY